MKKSKEDCYCPLTNLYEQAHNLWAYRLSVPLERYLFILAFILAIFIPTLQNYVRRGNFLWKYSLVIGQIKKDRAYLI
jgi:hypothetical protein